MKDAKSVPLREWTFSFYGMLSVPTIAASSGERDRPGEKE